jgi:hypothetical protein
MSRPARTCVALLLLVALAGCVGLGLPPGGDAEGGETTPGNDYARTTVELVDANGTRLATVEAWVADTWRKRYTGLSDTTELEPGEGMLFVHETEGTHSYVMRKMDFPLDMVFVAEDGTITTIHHAPLPADGEDLVQYSGRAKYVLELPMGYTDDVGVEVGDRVRVGEV